VAKILVEEFKINNRININSLVAAIESSKISRVDKKADDKIKKIKDAIKQLTKVVTDLAIKNITDEKSCNSQEYLIVELLDTECDNQKENLKNIRNL
ncbi:34246_t:CDS:2, partial [Racocetra persica]